MLSHPISLAVLEAAVHGAVEVEHVGGGFAPRRLPAASRPFHADDGLWRMASHTSGVTLRLRTDASRLALQLLFQREAAPGNDTAAHLATVVVGDDLRRFDEGDLLLEQPDRTAVLRPGEPTTVEFAVQPGEVTVWLPNAAGVTVLGGWADAPVEAAQIGRAHV